MTETVGVDAYRTMVRIRTFEEKLDELFRKGALPGFVHLYIGEEAVATGICAALGKDDKISSTHRGHGHLIAKGAELEKMMAELLGKSTGYCRGRGGSMHIVDFDLGIIGTNGIVGGGIPIAAGAAWGDAYLGRDTVTVAFFGDGAANQGVLLEAMNLAAVWKAPVIFVCENNLYGEWTRTDELTAGRIHERGVPLGIPGVEVDGNDVRAVHAAAVEAVARARAGEGPTLIEARTYRWSGHNLGEEAFAGDYRPLEEQQHWRDRDPLPSFARVLEQEGGATREELDAIAAEEREAVEAALAFAQQSPDPDPADAFDGLFAEKQEVQR